VNRLSLNPNAPIPLKVCRICWNLLDSSTSYCRRCGHDGSVFAYRDVVGERCTEHPDRRATELCNYCQRPFCAECLAVNENTVLSMGTFTYQCALCIVEIELLQQGWAERDKRYCGYHPNEFAQESCALCKKATCQFCTYYPVRGILKKRIERTPLCFSCIRTKSRPCIAAQFAEETNWHSRIFR
jgi:hypothetical protein